MEVVDLKSGHLLVNMSSDRPYFQITGLNPGRGLRLQISAANQNGKSEEAVLEGFTLKVAELQIGRLFSNLNQFSYVFKVYNLAVFWQEN